MKSSPIGKTGTAIRVRRGATAAAARAGMNDDPVEQVVWQLGRAYYSYVGLLEELLSETDIDRYLAPGMGPVLFALFEKDHCSIKEIGARVQLSGSTLTGLLGRMEAAKLVVRRRDDQDGRVVRVGLTALGRSLEPRCRWVLQTMTDVFQAGLGADAVEPLRQLLERLTEALRSQERSRRQARKESSSRSRKQPARRAADK